MRKYYHLLLAVLFVVISVMFLKDYIQGADEKKVKSLQELVSSQTIAVAVLDSIYKETTIKIAGVPTKHYETGYSFTVNGNEYKGKASLNAPPSGSTVNVKYLSSDPSINSADPQKELKSEIEKDSSNASLYIALMFLAVSGFYFWRYNSAKKQEQ